MPLQRPAGSAFVLHSDMKKCKSKLRLTPEVHFILTFLSELRVLKHVFFLLLRLVEVESFCFPPVKSLFKLVPNSLQSNPRDHLCPQLGWSSFFFRLTPDYLRSDGVNTISSPVFLFFCKQRKQKNVSICFHRCLYKGHHRPHKAF